MRQTAPMPPSACCAATGFGYARGGESNRRRPGQFDWRRTPGPRCFSALGGGFASLLCLAAAVLSSAVGEGGLELLEEPTTFRLYNCQRCRMQLCICAQCDCGNLYCPGECAELAGLGAVGGYKDLARFTTLGGTLFVFSLPDSAD